MCASARAGAREPVRGQPTDPADADAQDTKKAMTERAAAWALASAPRAGPGRPAAAGADDATCTGSLTARRSSCRGGRPRSAVIALAAITGLSLRRGARSAQLTRAPRPRGRGQREQQHATWPRCDHVEHRAPDPGHAEYAQLVGRARCADPPARATRVDRSLGARRVHAVQHVRGHGRQGRPRAAAGPATPRARFEPRPARRAQLVRVWRRRVPYQAAGLYVAR